MDRSIFIIEPDLERRKQITRLLVQAGYDAIVTGDADKALRQLYQTQPDAVILSNRLSADELDQLSDAIITIANLPLIKLDDGSSIALVARRLIRSTRLPELLETLNEVLEPGLPMGKQE